MLSATVGKENCRVGMVGFFCFQATQRMRQCTYKVEWILINFWTRTVTSNGISTINISYVYIWNEYLQAVNNSTVIKTTDWSRAWPIRTQCQQAWPMREVIICQMGKSQNRQVQLKKWKVSRLPLLPVEVTQTVLVVEVQVIYRCCHFRWPTFLSQSSIWKPLRHTCGTHGLSGHTPPHKQWMIHEDSTISHRIILLCAINGEQDWLIIIPIFGISTPYIYIYISIASKNINTQEYMCEESFLSDFRQRLWYSIISLDKGF